jgi:hypothetical protein
MNRDFPQFKTSEFLTREADHIDGEIEDAEKRLGGTFDTLASMLPRELKDHGRPGQYLQSIQVP